MKRVIVTRECPVCWQSVEMGVYVFGHADTAGNRCPMSMKRAHPEVRRIDITDEVAA